MTATIHTAAPGAASPGATFESLNPANGDIVGVYPICTRDDVDAAVARAHDGAAWWGALSFAERAEYLLTWRSVIARRIGQLAQLMHLETGKPTGDAQLEIVLAIDHIAWAAKHAKKVLGPQKVNSGLLMANQASTVEYRPLGVIGVIGPWNYPVFSHAAPSPTPWPPATRWCSNPASTPPASGNGSPTSSPKWWAVARCSRSSPVSA